MIWRGSLNATPRIVIPKHVMPQDNAYDIYLNACKRIMHEVEIKVALGISGQQNPHVYTLAEKEAMVKLNEPAIALTREGLTHEYCCPRAGRDGYNIKMLQIRNLGFLLALKGQVMAQKGDWGAAMDSFLDTYELGQVIPRGGSIYEAGVGRSIQSVAKPKLWQAVKYLNAVQSRAAINCMSEISAKRTPLANLICEDKWNMLEFYQELFKKPNWRGYYLWEIHEYPKAKTEFGTAWMVVTNKLSHDFMTCSKRELATDYASFMDEWAKYVSKPYAAKSKIIPSTSNPFIYTGNYDGWFYAETKDRIMESLFIVTLALRAYKLKHGSYPNKLDELVPSYIKSVPDDLFVLNKPIKYIKTSSSYILYSVGPDGKDDGGKPCIDTRTSVTEMRYYVDWNSTGDMVAGVNN